MSYPSQSSHLISCAIESIVLFLCEKIFDSIMAFRTGHVHMHQSPPEMRRQLNMQRLNKFKPGVDSDPASARRRPFPDQQRLLTRDTSSTNAERYHAAVLGGSGSALATEEDLVLLAPPSL